MKRERAVPVDAELLEEAERRVGGGGELAAFVNDAVRHELQGLPTDAPSAGGAAVELCRTGYLRALLDRDARRARGVVETAMGAGATVAEMYAGVFQPVLEEIGHRWALEEINVAQEHFATTLTQTLIPTLAPHARLPPTGGRLAVVTSTPKEQHLLGAQMVADLLERDGWEVVGLGADTPAADLVELVEMECPDVVALSASTAGRWPGVAEVLTALATVRPRPLVVVGGALFTDEVATLARELGADLVMSDVRALLAILRERFPAGAEGVPG